MDLNKLYYFYVVAKHEHVTRGAEELHISQPALTKTIKQLEEELGVPLFKKHKRNIVLTEFGKYLKMKAESVFQILDEVPRELESMQGQVKNTIKLNVLSASTIVTEAIVSYKKINENAIFQVIQNEEEKDCNITVSTKLDDFEKYTEFVKTHIINEEIYLAVPYVKESGSVELKSFCDMGFVNLAGSKLFRIICDNFCVMAGFKPKIIFESDSIIAVKNIIGAGAGIGFWPAFSWGRASEEIRLLQINNPECKRELVIGLHGNSSGIAEEFYEYLIDFIDVKRTVDRKF